VSRIVVLGLALGGCTSGTDNDWFLFNSENDTIEVRVTEEENLGDPVTIDLHSTTGAVVVGSATLTPGSGPVGTTHDLVVEVGETWAEQVGLVSVAADSGDRGVESFDLRRDSAALGLWVKSIESSGVAGESRTDVLTIQLFQEEITAEPRDTATP
jgi:hypothetical protein